MKFTPDEFRRMSMGEFLLAVEGVQMANGTYKKESEKLTWNDVLDFEDYINDAASRSGATG